MTFAKFEKFLQDLGTYPENCKRIAAFDYHKVTQNVGQGVQSFVTYLKDLDQQMEPLHQNPEGNKHAHEDPVKNP